jgi:hypothetical protein
MAVVSAAIAIFTGLAIAAPDDAKPPQRERDFIAIVDKVRTQYDAAKSVDGRRDARLDQQIALHNFLGLNHYAQDWVGTFARSETTPEGYQSIEIEVAPGVVLTTWNSKYDDEIVHTMAQPHGRLWPVLKTLTVGDQVRFSANVLGSLVSSDADMVQRPRLIAQFDTLAKLDDPSAPH